MTEKLVPSQKKLEEERIEYFGLVFVAKVLHSELLCTDDGWVISTKNVKKDCKVDFVFDENFNFVGVRKHKKPTFKFISK